MKITKEMLLQSNDPVTTWNGVGLMHKINDKPFALIAHNLKTDQRLPIGHFKSFTLNTNAYTLECTNTIDCEEDGITLSTNTNYKFNLKDDVDFIFVVDNKEISLNDYREEQKLITINPDVLHVGDFVRLDIYFKSFEYTGTAIVDIVCKYGIYFLMHDLGGLEPHYVTANDLGNKHMHFECELLHKAENPHVKKG